MTQRTPMLKSQNLKHILTVQVILLPKTTKKLQNLIQKNQKQNQRICPHKAPVTMKLNSPNKPRHSEGSQPAHQWGRQQLWEDVPESLDGGREADLGEIHQRLLTVLSHTLDSL